MTFNYNIEVDNIFRSKLLFIYYILEEGWEIKKENNKYILKKPNNNNNNNVYLDNYLDNLFKNILIKVCNI
tara:strand:+ start:60 stop:272 length:213 start_codon:yes stop_codon:yes gene_type:complete